MKITNLNSLPAPLVEAVTRHPREYSADRISVSELIQPPQLRALTVKHQHELEEDASDRLWALMGTLLHQALEQNAQGMKNVISEEELTLQVLGWTLVGHYDLSEMLLDGELLTDYKLTSVWSIKDGLKREWEEQLNVYAHLIRSAGRHVNQLQIVAIGRDWSKNKARYEKDYPKHQVQVLTVPMWTPEDTQLFIEDRVRLHQKAQIGEWPECTAAERWAKPTQYAMMKQGQKRAVKLFDSKEWAERHCGSANYVVERQGESTRCAAYCACLKFCKQGQELTATPEKEELQVA